MVKRRRRIPIEAKPVVYTVKEFCAAHRISINHYYVLKKKGMTPREMRVGHRNLISHDAAAAWRKWSEERGE
jgi:hypothetical protein